VGLRREPFFAQPLSGKRRERDVLVAAAWDITERSSDQLFADASDEKLRIVWLLPAEAAASLWELPSRHRRYAEPWLALRLQEQRGVEAAIDRSEIAESAGGR